MDKSTLISEKLTYVSTRKSVSRTYRKISSVMGNIAA